MPRPIIVAATSLVAVLVLGACGEKDATEEDVHDVLTNADATEAQADCAAPEIKKALTQDQLNDFAKASDVDDINAEIDEKVTPILDECLGSGSEGEGEDDSETTESTESTTTTTAG